MQKTHLFCMLDARRDATEIVADSVDAYTTSQELGTLI